MGWTAESAAPAVEAPAWHGPARLPELRVHPGNARITFSARLCGLLTVRGEFTEFDGRARWAADEPRRSSLEATISAASIRTGIAMRDHHLRGWSYLDAAAYPVISFRSRSLACGEPRLMVRGSLTLRGITGEAELACSSRRVALPGEGAGDAWLLVGEMAVSRSRFGVGRPARALGPADIRPLIIGDLVRIRVEVRVPPA
ncbi:MAG TPA: YceI family protein [Gemmatimonadaceae bacterium]|nr:YceI family protein [Gemmatimonadaceae bacterium]